MVPEPLEVIEPVVKYEFIRMPDSTGFGDYTETGQVIPVRLKGEEGAYTHAMYLDDEGPIAGGRELWGFPKKLARPKIEIESDVLVGTLHYGSVLCASGTMGYKHRPVDLDTVVKGMKAPNFILKIIPHVDGSPRICELVRFHLEDITLKEAWTGPAALGLFPACALRRRPAAGPRGRLRAAFQGGPDAGIGNGGVRLYGEVTASGLIHRHPGDLAGAVAVVAMRRLAEGRGQFPFLRFIAPLHDGVGDDVVGVAVRADRRQSRRLPIDHAGGLGRFLVQIERIKK